MDHDWEAAFRRAYRIAYGVLRNADLARDVAQDAWLRAYVKLDTFRGESSFGAWVGGIAFHLACDRRRRLDPPAVDPDDLPGREDPERDARTRETRHALLGCLERLTQRQRAMFLAKYLDGTKGGEIASAFGVRPGTLWATLAQVSARLRECMQRHGIGGGALS